MTLGLYERAWDLTSKPRNTPIVQARRRFIAFDKCFELELEPLPVVSLKDAPTHGFVRFIRFVGFVRTDRQTRRIGRTHVIRSPFRHAILIRGRPTPRNLTNSSLQFFTGCPALPD